MTVYDFQLLSQTVQVNLLYKEGVYVGKRKINSSSVLLYQLEGFYVEVYYKKYRCSVIRIHCFRSTTLLDPYLEQIDVEHLVSYF